jgi:hypothetical protein
MPGGADFLFEGVHPEGKSEVFFDQDLYVIPFLLQAIS